MAESTTESTSTESDRSTQARTGTNSTTQESVSRPGARRTSALDGGQAQRSLAAAGLDVSFVVEFLNPVGGQEACQ